MTEPRFGPAGNSESFAAAGFKKSEDAPAWLAQMGLTAFEYQCGRGVRCGEETALKIGAAAKQHGIRMSIHAPYFINLSSEESERMEKNVGYVLETARLAVPLGATRMVVHCGGQGKLTRDRAMRNSHANVKNILRALDEAHLTGCTVCLETMGKKSVLGTAEEVYYDPRHPYTKGLLRSLPALAKRHGALHTIPGMPPTLIDPPEGDAFACRNPQALAIDYQQQPPMFPVSDTHYAATWLLDPRAPQLAPLPEGEEHYV